MPSSSLPMRGCLVLGTNQTMKWVRISLFLSILFLLWWHVRQLQLVVHQQQQPFWNQPQAESSSSFWTSKERDFEIVPSADTDQQKEDLFTPETTIKSPPPAASWSPPQSMSSIHSPPLSTTTTTTIHGIPKIIRMYWDQGLDIAGLNSKPNNKHQADHACVTAWQFLHPTWDIHIVNRTLAKKLAPKLARLQSIRKPQPRSSRMEKEEKHRICPVKLGNLLRTELLALYGGVYTDTSICPMRPLEDYLGKLVGDGGFYLPPHFDLAGNMSRSQLLQHHYEMCPVRGPSVQANRQLADRARMMDNFFLVARPRHYIIQQWMDAYYKRLRDTLRTTRDTTNVCHTLPYYIHQCTFTLQVLHDPQFERAWTAYRNRIRPHNGYWQHEDTEGICYGGNRHGTVAHNLTYVWNQCVWVKKQKGRLLDNVTSPAYHHDILTRVQRGVAQ